MSEINRNNYKKRFGDRKDGRRIRSLDPIFNFIPFIMKDRNDATNYFREKLDITAAEQFIHELRNKGYKGIGMLHLFISSYIRCVAQFPALNRFIAGQRIYSRNSIEIVMTVKKKIALNSDEAEVKVRFEPTDGVTEIYEKINAEIDKAKASMGDNATENVAKAFLKLPRVFFRIAIRFFYWLDYHGWLPEFLLNASPFHGSLYIVDLGSIGLSPVMHHIYNFGTIPIFLVFGAKRKEYELNADGSVSEKKYIEYTVSCDERICDGYCFAQAFKYLKHYMRNPHLLNKPPESIVQDIE